MRHTNVPILRFELRNFFLQLYNLFGCILALPSFLRCNLLLLSQNEEYTYR